MHNQWKLQVKCRLDNHNAGFFQNDSNTAQDKDALQHKQNKCGSISHLKIIINIYKSLLIEAVHFIKVNLCWNLESLYAKYKTMKSERCTIGI